MGNVHDGGVAKRASNRIATRQRIADAALRLFDSKGYDGTTLEEVARTAGVSPRTFFHYFKTKDELVEFFRAGAFEDALGEKIKAQLPGKSPLAIMRNCLVDLVQQFESPASASIDRLLNSTESLRARKQQVFAVWEAVADGALSDLFAHSVPAAELSNAAMIGIGALRLALARRREEHHSKPLAVYLESQFSNMPVLGLCPDYQSCSEPRSSACEGRSGEIG